MQKTADEERSELYAVFTAMTPVFCLVRFEPMIHNLAPNGFVES